MYDEEGLGTIDNMVVVLKNVDAVGPSQDQIFTYPHSYFQGAGATKRDAFPGNLPYGSRYEGGAGTWCLTARLTDECGSTSSEFPCEPFEIGEEALTD